MKLLTQKKILNFPMRWLSHIIYVCVVCTTFPSNGFMYYSSYGIFHFWRNSLYIYFIFIKYSNRLKYIFVCLFQFLQMKKTNHSKTPRCSQNHFVFVCACRLPNKILRMTHFTRVYCMLLTFWVSFFHSVFCCCCGCCCIYLFISNSQPANQSVSKPFISISTSLKFCSQLIIQLQIIWGANTTTHWEH